MLKNPPAKLDHHWPPLLTNRRGAPRLARRFPTRWDGRDSMAVDLSTTGMRLEADQKLAVGANVLVELLPGANQSLALAATVVWSRASYSEGLFQAGLAFREESPRLLELIR